MATVNSGQSRLFCWLDADLNLAGSIFDTAGHTVFALSSTNGASQSWKAGRALNSLPNSRVVRFGVYRIATGTAAINLPNRVAGAGGTVDLSYITGLPVAVLNVTPTSGTTATTFSFNATGSTPGNGEFILGYDWQFGTGQGSSFANAPTKQFTTPGTYVVSLRVMNNNNVYSLPVTRTIVVSSPSPAPTPVPDGTQLVGMNI